MTLAEPVLEFGCKYQRRVLSVSCCRLLSSIYISHQVHNTTLSPEKSALNNACMYAVTCAQSTTDL